MFNKTDSFISHFRQQQQTGILEHGIIGHVQNTGRASKVRIAHFHPVDVLSEDQSCNWPCL